MSQSIAVLDAPVVEEEVRNAAVAARGLQRTYGEGDTAVHALRGADLDVAREQLTAVMGPSGSGKSTLMHLLAGLDRPSGGEVYINETNIGTLNDPQLTDLRRRHIGFIFQFFNLLPMLTAEENVVLPLSIAGRKPEAEWLEQLLGKGGVAHPRRHRPAQLSGGQQQRGAVAKAPVSGPGVPFAAPPN